jgi:acetyl-CoA carboxylase biotin carboxyl carrier protein
VIDLAFIESLIRALDQSGLDSVEIERGGTRIRLSKTPPPAPAAPAQTYQMPAPAPPPVPVGAPHAPGAPAAAPSQTGGSGEGRPAADDRKLLEIKSPMVGTFYLAPAPDAPPYVDVGSRIKKGDTLCIIEAMKLMNELESEVNGTVVEVLVDNGEPVEYGQVLFRVDSA